MGFFISKSSGKSILVQYIVIVGALFFVLAGMLDLIGVFPRNSIILSLLLIISSIAVIGITLLSRDFMIKRVAHKLNRFCLDEEFDKALHLIDKKIKSNVLGYEPNWLALKAMVFIKKENYDRAEELLTKLENEHPNFLHMLYYRACLESIKGHKEESISYLNKIINVQKQMIKQTSNPISDYFLKKRMEKFYSTLEKDEDLDFINKTSMFKKLLTDLEEIKYKYDKKDDLM